MPVALRRPRNVILIVLILGALLGGWYWHEHNAVPKSAGDPDPGGRIMAQLTQTLGAVPTSVEQSDRESSHHRWETCDGTPSAYGWDDLAVNVNLSAAPSTDDAFVKAVDNNLRKRGWTMTHSTQLIGPWYWEKKLSGGETATIQLIDNDTSDDLSNRWSFQASSPAATHPLKGC